MGFELPLAPVYLLPALAAVLLGGAVRGFTGFGSAVVMAPILGPLIGPAVAVPTILSLDFLLNLRLVPQALHQARWGRVFRLSLGAAVLLPVGAYLIVHLPEPPLVIATGLAVIAAAAVIFSGWRYQGPVNAATDIGVGAVSGFLGGATSIGGPPVVVYLLALPGSSIQARADLIGFLGVTTIAALVTFGLYDALTVPVMTLVALGLPVYLAGSELGRWAFWRMPDQKVRGVVQVLLVLNGVIAVVTGIWNLVQSG